MNASNTDGGPAFPCHTNPLPSKLANAPQGMTLRDWSAGQALAGISAQTDERTCPREQVEEKSAKWREADAKYCYQLADAMIAARKCDAQTPNEGGGQ
ncbi:hypothetical protein GCM10023212_04980 [Luteolibacter yonseiensis]